VHPLGCIAIYLGGVFLGAGLAAPWLFQAVQWAATHSDHFVSLAQQPFHRYVNRCLLGLALIGLVPFFRALGVQSASQLGFVRTGDWRLRLGQGFGLGFSSLAVLVLVMVWFGARELDLTHSPGAWWRYVRGSVLAAVLVAVLEEILFRGALFGSLKRVYRLSTALLLSSMIFGLVHFFEKPPSPATLEWWSGLVTLSEMARGFGDVRALVPGLVNLVLAGMVLALAFERTGSLYFPIGLHGGWIFWQKSYAFLIDPVPGASSWFWGGPRVVDGWAAVPILALTLGICARWPVDPRTRMPRAEKE
jgi:membrane protease YdiL (CAAX protease family)